MELIKYYDCAITYHSRKVNVVVNMLSTKSSSKGKLALQRELRECGDLLNKGSIRNLIVQFQVKTTLEEEIVKSQPEDPVLRKLTEEVRCER